MLRKDDGLRPAINSCLYDLSLSQKLRAYKLRNFNNNLYFINQYVHEL